MQNKWIKSAPTGKIRDQWIRQFWYDDSFMYKVFSESKKHTNNKHVILLTVVDMDNVK